MVDGLRAHLDRRRFRQELGERLCCLDAYSVAAEMDLLNRGGIDAGEQGLDVGAGVQLELSAVPG